jgi:hypothetical protein
VNELLVVILVIAIFDMNIATTSTFAFTFTAGWNTGERVALIAIKRISTTIASWATTKLKWNATFTATIMMSVVQ